MSSIFTELTAGVLSVEIAPHIVSGNYDAIADIMNRKDISKVGNLSVHDVKQYISLVGLRLPILDSVTASCREFNLALEDFKESGFDLANPIIFAKIDSVLNGLVGETLIPAFTTTNKAVLLSLGNKLISRAEQIGLQIDSFTICNHLTQGV